MEDIQTGIIYNTDQQKALNELFAFCDNEDKLIHTLKGSAGTDKTTILDKFIRECKFKYNLVVSAPTHKAKKVVAAKTGQNSISTDYF